MVDSIAAKPISGGKVTGVTKVAAPARAASVPTAPASDPAPETLAKVLAAEMPIDQERVARIKQAIATGTFPILPATIADRLLALKLEWRSNDPS